MPIIFFYIGKIIMNIHVMIYVEKKNIAFARPYKLSLHSKEP